MKPSSIMRSWNDAYYRKLWAKMREGDWRTATKAFYLLHRFAANGASEQANNFQMR